MGKNNKKKKKQTTRKRNTDHVEEIRLVIRVRNVRIAVLVVLDPLVLRIYLQSLYVFSLYSLVYVV
jgi:hypothetical protein